MEASTILPVSELKRNYKEETKKTELDKKIDKFIVAYREIIQKTIKNSIKIWIRYFYYK